VSFSQCRLAPAGLTTRQTHSKLLAVARADPQISLYDRDGTDGKPGSAEPKIRTTRGDQYIHDLAKTKGHTAACSGAAWSFARESVLVTGAADGTVRLWDVEHGPRAMLGTELSCSNVLKTKSDRPGRNGVLAMTLTSAERVVAACADGTLQFWSLKEGGSYSARPDTTLAQFPLPAVDDGAPVFVEASSDGRKIVLAHSSSMRAWDVRKLQAPLWQRTDVPGVRGVCFSPDDAHVAVSALAGVGLAHASTGKPAAAWRPLPGAPSCNLMWHGALNQLAVGCSNGAAVVLFDPALSERGAAMLAVESRMRTAARVAAQPKKPAAEMYADVDQEALTRADYDAAVPIFNVEKIRAAVPGKAD